MRSNEASAQETRIWELHCEGFAPSAIADELGVDADRVREAVVGVWRFELRPQKAPRKRTPVC